MVKSEHQKTAIKFFLIVDCLISSASVYMVKRRSTCSTSANQSPTSRHGVISDLLVGDCWTCRSRGGVHLPGGLSLWLVRRCGTRCRTTRETRQSAETLSAST